MKEKEVLIGKIICVFVCLLIISGMSNTNALPVLGSIIGIDNMNIGFNYKDNNLNINIPVIKYKEELDEVLNSDIRHFSNSILEDFFLDYNDLNHESIDMKYSVVKDTPEWFTLKIEVLEIS